MAKKKWCHVANDNAQYWYNYWTGKVEGDAFAATNAFRRPYLLCIMVNGLQVIFYDKTADIKVTKRAPGHSDRYKIKQLDLNFFMYSDVVLASEPEQLRYLYKTHIDCLEMRDER